MDRASLRRIITQYGRLCLALAVMIVVFSIVRPSFFSAATFRTISSSIPDLTVLAVGMTLVLIVGGIDLSVGSVLALSGVSLGVLMFDHKWPFWLAILPCMFIGSLCGFANGMLSGWFRIPSFIITLGMLEIARGAAFKVTDSQTKYIGSSVSWLGEPIDRLYVSPSFLFAITIVIVGQLLLERTVLGRLCVAIGTNAETVRLSGIRVLPYSVAIFTICGFLCSIASIIQIGRQETSDPNAGTGTELEAIAACVIGGTSLKGGHGSVISTFFGVLIISVLRTGLNLLGVDDPVKRIVTGAVIVIAVLIDSLRSSKNR
jgi:ribose transport system permease protein